jgi:hypothetical protein
MVDRVRSCIIICDIYSFFFTYRQIPGLPRASAASVKRVKTNITGINGRILDPIARAAAQRAAKAVNMPTSGRSAAESSEATQATSSQPTTRISAEPESDTQATILVCFRCLFESHS